MRDLVSNRMMGGVALIGAMSIAWAIFVSQDLAWPALVTLGVLACLAAVATYWRSTQSPRSIAQILDGVEAEPRLAAAVARAVRPSRGVSTP